MSDLNTLIRRPAIIGFWGNMATHLQCIQALCQATAGTPKPMTVLFEVDRAGTCKITILEGGQPKRFAEGPTNGVALRRLFTGVKSDPDLPIVSNPRFAEKEDG